MGYGPPKGSREWKALEGILAFTYQLAAADIRDWRRRAGARAVRVQRAGAAVVGGCMVYDMGLWLGGRVVPSLGVAGVGVAPEHRASGAGSEMMRGVVLEAARRRVPLSSLYPATQPVYRRAGYDRAGHWVNFAVDCSEIDAREREPAVRPARPADRRSIEALYAEMAGASAGLVARNSFLWERLLTPPKGAGRTYIVHEGRAALGYLVTMVKKLPDMHQDLLLPDLAFRTPAAGRRILSFLASQRSFVRKVRWRGGPQDPLAALLREQSPAVEKHWHWMVRVCDLRRALEGRGYAPGVEAEVDLEVEDPIVAGNRGRWVLRVGKGRAKVVRGGGGAVRLDVNALASVYTGYAAPREVRTWATLDGPDGALDALAAAFAGPAPWNREMY